MSEQSSEYDPMSMHADIDAIYSSQEMLEHALLLRTISQEATRRRAHNQPRRRTMETIYVPELFGSWNREGLGQPPVSPPEPPDTAKPESTAAPRASTEP